MEIWHWYKLDKLASAKFKTTFETILTFLISPCAGWFRSFIADYGVPLMVVFWTALSYGVPGKVPHGVPRRLFCPLPWEPASLYHWTVVKVRFF